MNKKKFKQPHGLSVKNVRKQNTKPVYAIYPRSEVGFSVLTRYYCPNADKFVTFGIMHSLAMQIYKLMKAKETTRDRVTIMDKIEFTLEQYVLQEAAKETNESIKESIESSPQRKLGHKFWRAIFEPEGHKLQEGEDTAHIILNELEPVQTCNDAESLKDALNFVMNFYAEETVSVLSDYHNGQIDAEGAVTAAHRFMAIKALYERECGREQAD